MIIPKNSTFCDYNLNFYIMIYMHSKYDNMQKNKIFYVLICINNHTFNGINFMLSVNYHEIIIQLSLVFNDML